MPRGQPRWKPHCRCGLRGTFGPLKAINRISRRRNASALGEVAAHQQIARTRSYTFGAYLVAGLVVSSVCGGDWWRRRYGGGGGIQLIHEQWVQWVQYHLPVGPLGVHIIHEQFPNDDAPEGCRSTRIQNIHVMSTHSGNSDPALPC